MIDQRKCNYCGSREHYVEYCPKTWQGSTNQNQLRCDYCGSREHDIEYCPKTSQGQFNLRQRR